MDYKTFFEELKKCYLENGLAFNFPEFEKIHDLFAIKNGIKAFKKSSITKTFSNYSFPTKKFKSSILNKNVDSKYCSVVGNKNVTYTANHHFDVKTAIDFIYKIAYLLSKEIGKLPDNLHSRMVLSLDNSRYRRLYISRFV